ncbi:MAG: hypothetical protein ACK56W_11055 [Pirellula sp.]|jgi:hypothetical protein|nr:hypothetical protein [Pirellula sp.]
MLETFRRYWIAMLVLVMIGLHASIVGLIRHQASLAKVDASCEVDLGNFLAFQSGGKPPISMQLHAIVPINHRMKSRQLIELNQSQIRQALEEHLRQIDGRVLTDPYLTDLRSQLLDVMVQTIGNSSIEELVITKVFESKDANTLEFIARGSSKQPRQLVATLRNQQESDHDAEHDDEEHGEQGAEEHDGEAAHVDDQHGADASHGAESKSSSKSSGASHGSKSSSGAQGSSKPKASSAQGSSGKKPAAKSSHGSASDKKDSAKKSGH